MKASDVALRRLFVAGEPKRGYSIHPNVLWMLEHRGLIALSFSKLGCLISLTKSGWEQLKQQEKEIDQ